VFNLGKFINKEFLRPRENSCKWFNKFLACEEVSIYKKGEQVQFFCVKTTKWIDSVKLWIDLDIRNMSHITMKNDTIQTMIESIQNPRDKDWYDSY